MYLAFYKNKEAGSTKALLDQMTPAMKSAVAAQMQVPALTPSELAAWAMTARRAAGTAPPSHEDSLLIGASRLLHIDDQERIAFLRALLSRDASSSGDLSTRERRIAEGFILTLTPEERDIDAALRALARSTAARAELLQVLDVLEDRAEHQTVPIADDLHQPHRRTPGGHRLAAASSDADGRVQDGAGGGGVRERQPSGDIKPISPTAISDTAVGEVRIASAVILRQPRIGTQSSDGCWEHGEMGMVGESIW